MHGILTSIFRPISKLHSLARITQPSEQHMHTAFPPAFLAIITRASFSEENDSTHSTHSTQQNKSGALTRSTEILLPGRAVALLRSAHFFTSNWRRNE